MARAKFNKQITQRVQTLLNEMTLAQKVGQMTQAERTTCSAKDVFKYHLGSVLSAAGSCPSDNHLQDWIAMNDAYWHASMQSDDNHLAIPILYGLDAIHGNNNVKGAVVFPHNIGLGASRDFSLVEKIARATAEEVLAAGVDWVFAPNLAVARDYHWGRTYESFSEDPQLVSQFAQHMVTGLQGKLDEAGVLACVKHWIGDGGTIHGIDQGNTVLDWQQLEQTHVTPYYAAIEAGAMAVMVSFSSWNGDKCHAHHFLLTEILKGKMQFPGLLISDMQGIDYLADDFYLAVAQGVNAGIDMFMVPDNWRQFIEHLISHVELGTVPIQRINDAVTRILSVKMAYGLFDKPCPSQRRLSGSERFGCQQHREIAREAVRKSLVLLKNQNNLLPLSRQAKIAVCGRNANNIGHQCGGFTITWQGLSGNDDFPHATSIWQGIQAARPDARLCDSNDLLTLDPDNTDVAILVVGEKPYAEGVGDIRHNDDILMESGSQVNGQIKLFKAAGDSIELQHMYPEDLVTMQTLHDKGIPIVAILVSGRPLIINQELELASAFVAAWLPGSEGGGVADVLFGEHDFVGRLAFSWPKQSNLPVNIGDRYYNPKFPFGFGLSYGKVNPLKSAG